MLIRDRPSAVGSVSVFAIAGWGASREQSANGGVNLSETLDRTIFCTFAGDLDVGVDPDDKECASVRRHERKFLAPESRGLFEP